MIYKQRSIPNELQALISLDKRLSHTHEQKHAVQKSLLIYQAGYNGELEFDGKIAYFKPEYPHAILHDLYLQQDGTYFQIDSLLITPSTITIFEVKNFKDKTVIKSKPTQFVRVYQNGDRRVIPNPIIEVERKIQLLTEWLNNRGIKAPIEGIITFSYKTELEIDQPEPNMKILLIDEVPNYLSGQRLTEDILDKQTIHQLATSLAIHHRNYNPFPLIERYEINPADISPGVLCPSCNKLGMQWGRKKWNCICGHTSKTAHHQAIQDWFMLIKTNMTNREFRYFTKLDSRNTARDLLANASLQRIGERKAAHYILHKEKFQST